jgi:hypothetical protein
VGRVFRVVNRLYKFRSPQNVPLNCSSVSYDSVKYGFGIATFPTHARQFALFALELLPHCRTLGTMPELWRFQLTRDIPDLHAEFGKRMSTQLMFVCRHWVHQLCEADCMDDEVVAALLHSIPTLHYWIAAMGIMGEMEQACRMLSELRRWLVRRDARKEESCSLDLSSGLKISR